MASAAEPAAAPAPTPWATALLAALLTTLEHPAAWAVSLAGFLARGGVLVFLVPIVVLPTPAALQATLSPLLRPLVFGEPSVGLVLLGLGLVASVAGAIVLGGLVGAWADVVLVRQVAASLADAPPRWPPRRGLVPAVLVVRLLAHLPLALALAWGAIRIVEVAYRELMTPFEVVTPLVGRIVAGAPDALALVVLTWWLGEAAGGLGAREVVLGGQGVLRALGRGWAGLVREPLGSAATLLAASLLVVVAVAPALVASGAAWDRLRFLLFDGAPAAGIQLVLALFVALWLGGLVLAAVATAARSAMWTAEWLRRESLATHAVGPEAGGRVGTIGGGDGTDRGGWPTSEGSGTL